MKTPSPEDILVLTLNLCRIPSVSENGRENECAQFIFEKLSEIKVAPQLRLSVFKEELESDFLGRHSVFALLESPKARGRTLILTGHFDVVGIESFGQGASLAFDPIAYTKYLRSCPHLSAEALEDLNSKNWLFGRGVMDMKAGIALFLEVMKQAAQDPDLAINLLFLVVPDEEANSCGMRGSLRFLSRLITEKSLKIIGAFTGEPCFCQKDPENSDNIRPYYLGSTGKVMPFFYALGKEAHVGNFAQGFSSALMISEVVCLAEGDPRLYEGKGLDALAPPICLGLELRRQEYSVTIPDSAVAYFNVLFANKNLEAILHWAKMTAAQAASIARDKLELMNALAREKGASNGSVPNVNVLTFSNLVRLAESKITSEVFQKRLSEFIEGLDGQIEAREKAIRIAEWVITQAEIKRPAIIVGFLPPYYPAKINYDMSDDEQLFRRIVQRLAKRGEELAGFGRCPVHEVFSGITDLSFLGAPSSDDIQAVKSNLPGIDRLYKLPFELLPGLNVPVANMGPSGKDAHQSSERLELDYSLKVAPRLLVEAIEMLSHLPDR